MGEYITVGGSRIYETDWPYTYDSSTTSYTKISFRMRAANIIFDDGESLQAKLNNGKLKGAAGRDGTNGLNGINGKSAYELATECGATTETTVANWIHSLKGKDGTPGSKGDTGKSAFQAASEAGLTNAVTEEEWIRDIMSVTDTTLHDFIDIGTIYLDQSDSNVDNQIRTALKRFKNKGTHPCVVKLQYGSDIEIISGIGIRFDDFKYYNNETGTEDFGTVALFSGFGNTQGRLYNLWLYKNKTGGGATNMGSFSSRPVVTAKTDSALKNILNLNNQKNIVSSDYGWVFSDTAVVGSGGGTNGKSAYELAVQYGLTTALTEEEWITDLMNTVNSVSLDQFYTIVINTNLAKPWGTQVREQLLGTASMAGVPENRVAVALASVTIGEITGRWFGFTFRNNTAGPSGSAVAFFLGISEQLGNNSSLGALWAYAGYGGAGVTASGSFVNWFDDQSGGG